MTDTILICLQIILVALIGFEAHSIYWRRRTFSAYVELLLRLEQRVEDIERGARER